MLPSAGGGGGSSAAVGQWSDGRGFGANPRCSSTEAPVWLGLVSGEVRASLPVCPLPPPEPALSGADQQTGPALLQVPPTRYCCCLALIITHRQHQSHHQYPRRAAGGTRARDRRPGGLLTDWPLSACPSAAIHLLPPYPSYTFSPLLFPFLLQSVLTLPPLPPACLPVAAVPPPSPAGRPPTRPTQWATPP